jgi:hypothetical protein
MGSLSYISQKSILLLRFKAARMRLMATSEKIGSLSDTRIASAISGDRGSGAIGIQCRQ